jgi:hypothetical protein
MRQAIAFSKTFGTEIPIMSGPNFTLTVKNGILTTNNEPALRAALEKDLNSPIEKDRIMAKSVVATINEHFLLAE